MSTHSTTVILFGATGDLAQHKLFPALQALSGRLEEGGVTVLAIGRRPYSREDFQEQVKQSLTQANQFQEEAWQSFSQKIYYFQMDFLQPESYQGLQDFLHEHEQSIGSCQRLFYLAVAPEFYVNILSAIAEKGLHTMGDPCWSRIVVEKPFGIDEASAVKLDQQIAQLFNEEQIYRIDHYLGKETVQNLLAFRFANRLFEPLWNNNHIDHIQITVAEEEGIRDRGAYYDGVGAFRDVVQNHMLQLVSFLAIEQPGSFSFKDLSDRKAEILKVIRFDPHKTVFGQYEGYQQEEKVASGSQTETYAMACFYIDNERWQGVPFYIRTGKKLATRVSEVSVQFKAVSPALFQGAGAAAEGNLLTFRLQPDEGISLRLGVKTPRNRMQVEAVRMEFCYSASFRTSLPDAYELVFQDVLQGEQIHSLRADTIELSWHVIDQILANKSQIKLEMYKPGSWGPELADELMQAEGRRWLAHETQVCNGVIIEPEQS